MFTKEERSRFPYWFAHVCAYNMTALNCKAWKFKYLFHDIEKPFLRLFLPYKKVQKLHRENNRHHPEWLEVRLRKKDEKMVKYLYNFDYKGAIIDWESCRFTKQDCPLNAYNEYKRLLDYEHFKSKYPLITKYFYNEFSQKLLNAIEELNLKQEQYGI